MQNLIIRASNWVSWVDEEFDADLLEIARWKTDENRWTQWTKFHSILEEQYYYATLWALDPVLSPL